MALFEGEADEIEPETAEFTIEIDQKAPWQNDNDPDDVNDDGDVVADDVLLVIDYINGTGSGPIPDTSSQGPFHDADGDNYICAMDVMDIINLINANQDEEGEAPPEPIVLAAASSQTVLSSADLLNFLAYDLALQPRRRNG
jgi:hypothetical protein